MTDSNNSVKHMEAKELMIGDWVKMKLRRIGTQWYVDKVYSVSPDNELEYMPIPLTEKILKDNGFRDCGEIYEYQFVEDGETYRFYLKKMYNGDNVLDSWGTNVGGVLPSLIASVHELQHALRLCGLNDLADNFKIKR